VTEQPQTPEPAVPDGVTPAEPASEPSSPIASAASSTASSSTAESTWATPPEPARNSGAGDPTGAIESERPEIAVGAAFAGGFVLAMILKRLAR
jgi:hypothetical protein